jgi:uncharacterized membrane protein (DUF106 family)
MNRLKILVISGIILIASVIYLLQDKQTAEEKLNNIEQQLKEVRAELKEADMRLNKEF